MSVDKVLRDMVANEVARALEPVHAALAELQGNGALIARIAVALGQPIARDRGRPRKSASSPVTAARGAKRGRRANSEKGCAVIGCERPARSKGYCAAHYQKYRMLDRTRRLPPDWVADAKPGSVKNLALPRGRAGAKALAASRRT